MRQLAEATAAAAFAAIVAMAIAAPVLRAPSERVFGMEIVGRHHDPFTVMTQFERPIAVDPHSQPLTDLSGSLLARVSGGVAAYNWLVLLSFPLSAWTAYLLARHLGLERAGALLAAMAYAFSPFHLAHAAYHPQVAQTQWIPLYLLALWRCLDEATPSAVAFLAVATLTVTLSNFYGGMIAAVITPVAVAVYWLATRRRHIRADRSLAVTVGSLAIMAASGAAYALHVAGGMITNPAALAFPRIELFWYSAKWWSYLIPPVAHPFIGAAARRFWESAGVSVGLLEQQVSLGWAVVMLGLVAVVRWLVRDRRVSSLSRVPVLVAVAVAALLCSLSPERTVGAFTFVRPSALLYHLVPMFRSYARFGVVVQLMAALLAGIGLDWLFSSGVRAARIAGMALVVVAVGEYAVAPSASWRDVLPTTAHRWVMRQPGRIRALDCAPLDPESASVVWLSEYRVSLLGDPIGDCMSPDLPQALAAGGYTHLIVRERSAEQRWFLEHPVRDGLRSAARFDDGQVFTVTAPAPTVYVENMAGFSPREHDVAWTWRWMAADASWTVANTSARSVAATLNLELLAFHHARSMVWTLDGQAGQTMVVEPMRANYQIGPLTLAPGAHAVTFHAVEPPTVADDLLHNGDVRTVSCAIGAWGWQLQGEEP